jgi:hypothetical protein
MVRRKRKIEKISIAPKAKSPAHGTGLLNLKTLDD